MPVDGGTIASQVGASGGLWTHTPVDWRGNETSPLAPVPPGGWPANASVAVPPSGGRASAAPSDAPILTAVSVSAILATTATINYTIGATTPAAISQVEYGTTVAYGTVRPVSPNTGSGAKTVGLTGLTTATVYFYRVFATANSLTSYASGQFTTA